jgi:Uma2 family endonuclease
MTTKPLKKGATYDDLREVRIYAREGVADAWLVDPLARFLEVMSLEARHWRQLDRYEGEAKVCAAPFDVIEFELGALWL